MRTAGWIVLVLGAGSGCGSSAVCAPGATQACACPGGGQGAQSCTTDGAGWGECQCATAALPTPTAPAMPAAPVACVPGATQSCLCFDGSQGAQACSGDGRSWAACACAAGAPGSPVASGAVAPRAGARPTTGFPMTGFPGMTGIPGMTGMQMGTAAPIGPQPFQIRIVSASLAPSKPGGAPWDGDDSGPDVEVTVRVDGAGAGTVRSTNVRDNTSPQWNQSGNVTINRGDRLVVSMVDKDLVNDDPIASWTETFARPGRIRLASPAQSVNSLVIEVAAP